MTSVLLGGLSPLLLISLTPLRQTSSSAWWGALVIAVITGVRFSWLVAKNASRLTELVVWLFSYVFLGLAPMVQMRGGEYPGTTPLLDPDRNLAAVGVVLAGLAAFSVGVALGSRGSGSGPTASDGRLTRSLDPSRVLLLTSLSLLAWGYYASRTGLGPLFSSRSQRAAVEAAVWPNSTIAVLARAAAVWPLVVSLLALVSLSRRKDVEPLPGGKALRLVVLVALAVSVNPLGSPRFVTGSAVLAVLAGTVVARRPRRLRPLAVSLAVGLVFVFPYADVARTATGGSDSNAGGPVVTLSRGDFDAFAQINNTLAYVDINGTTNGRQLTGAALFFVPRTVWADKPVDTGILLADFRAYSFTNLSATVWSELFIDGGWPLLLIGMGLFGFLVGVGDRRASRWAGEGNGVLAWILPFYLVLVVRGSLIQSMAGLTAIVVCGLFVRGRRRT